MYEEERAKHSLLQQKLAKSEESLKNGVLLCIARLQSTARCHAPAPFPQSEQHEYQRLILRAHRRATHCTLGPAAVVCAALGQSIAAAPAAVIRSDSVRSAFGAVMKINDHLLGRVQARSADANRSAHSMARARASYCIAQ